VRALIPALVALVILDGRAAAADPSQEFIEARTVFRSGEYEHAANLFSSLLYPNSKLDNQQEVVDAHLMLAVAKFETGDQRTAEDEFKEAVELDPQLRITTYGFSQAATDFFEKKKRAHDEKNRELEEKFRRARELEQQRKAVNRIRIKENRNYYLNLVPFGVGQFQNGQSTKAMLFAGSQFVTGALSIGIYSYLTSRYPDGLVPRDEVDEARNLQILQIGAGVTFLGLVGWGVIDAFVNYEDKLRPLTPEEKQQYLRELEREQQKSALKLTPMLMPDGAGAALTWEF
jgi:tetratricopeptide (TPR) repeat protein